MGLAFTPVFSLLTLKKQVVGFLVFFFLSVFGGFFFANAEITQLVHLKGGELGRKARASEKITIYSSKADCTSVDLQELSLTAHRRILSSISKSK